MSPVNDLIVSPVDDFKHFRATKVPQVKFAIAGMVFADRELKNGIQDGILSEGS